jgi:Zn-dependent protease
MQGLGATGAQQSKDCSFAAGHVPGGAPLRVSWFLVIFFVYQLMDAVKMTGVPMWFRVAKVTAFEFILLLTVLTHEMGHGTMAKKLGGEISQVLLWPFGGICFTTRPPNRDARQKLVDDLKIVAAGPATHFPQAGIWLALLIALNASLNLNKTSPSWRLLVPFSPPQTPCLSIAHPMQGCISTWSGYLVHLCLVQAVQINVMLFLFNIFFPMYPMDGAKLIVCSLQLFCGTSAKFAAKVLIGTSVPLAVLFIGYNLKGMAGGGLMPGVTAYMGFMCLMESYKIYKLMQEKQLHTHPLFASARSEVRAVVDSAGVSQRLNDSANDDEEAPAPQVRPTELRPFSGAGRALKAPPASFDTVTEKTTPQPSRNSWLDRLERTSAERNKTVAQLEDERLERERMTHHGGGDIEAE